MVLKFIELTTIFYNSFLCLLNKRNEWGSLKTNGISVGCIKKVKEVAIQQAGKDFIVGYRISKKSSW